MSPIVILAVGSGDGAAEEGPAEAALAAELGAAAPPLELLEEAALRDDPLELHPTTKRPTASSVGVSVRATFIICSGFRCYLSLFRSSDTRHGGRLGFVVHRMPEVGADICELGTESDFLRARAR